MWAHAVYSVVQGKAFTGEIISIKLEN